VLGEEPVVLGLAAKQRQRPAVPGGNWQRGPRMGM
jgi:hypothetical protein